MLPDKPLPKLLSWELPVTVTVTTRLTQDI